jgi:Arabinose efflux permease
MLLGSIVTFAVLYSPQPLISVFSKQYQVSASSASLVISLATIALAVGLLFVSAFSNAWGRKGIMSMSLVVISILAILSHFALNFQFLLAIRLFEGFSAAGFPAIAIAYLNEEISTRSIGGAMGVYIAGTAVGGFVGRVVIGALTDIVSWQFSFLVLGIISLICSVWFWWALPESKHFQHIPLSSVSWIGRFKGVLNKKLIVLNLIGFLFMGIFVTLFNYIGYPLTRAPYYLSQTVLGFIFVVNLIGTVSSVLFGKISVRYDRAYLIILAAAFLFIGALLTLSGYIIVKIFGLMVFAFGFFAGHTVASGWVGIVAPLEKKAEAASMYLLFYYTGSSFIGWIGGFFWTGIGWGGLISMLCTLITLCAALSLFMKKMNNVNPAEFPTPEK